jgi:hypothetical protein
MHKVFYNLATSADNRCSITHYVKSRPQLKRRLKMGGGGV